MGTRSVRLDEDVYETIKARKRDDETFSEAIERLIDGPSLLSLRGILSDEDATAFREAIDEADTDARKDVDGLVESVDR